VESKEAFGLPVPCVKLEKLIALKRAAGRPKDFEPIAELEAIRQERLSGRTDFQPQPGGGGRGFTRSVPRAGGAARLRLRRANQRSRRSRRG
jgi:hypothetical protein